MNQAVAVAQQALQDVLAGVRLNAVKIPALPEVAMRVRVAAANPNVTVDSLCAELMRDAGLTARIMRVANSPLVRSRSEIRTLQQAVTRLGINYVRDLATAFALEGSFHPRNPAVGRTLRQVWTVSKETAAISSALARQNQHLHPDQALLAGLLHRIGTLPLLAAVDEHADLNIDSEELMLMIDEIHSDLGSYILREWRFPEEIAAVPEQYRNPYREHDGPADLIDAVSVAYLIIKLSDKSAEWQPPWSQIAAAKRLGLDSSIDTLEGFGKSEEVQANRGALLA